MSRRLTCELKSVKEKLKRSEPPNNIARFILHKPCNISQTTVKVPIDRSVVAARRRLCGGGGGGKRGEMRLGEKEEEEAVLVAPISQFLTTSNIRMRSGAISGGLYFWVDL